MVAIRQNSGYAETRLCSLIISHRHRFIFIHCRKTAGSSIAGLLSRHLGPEDLHLGTWPEAFNQGIEPNRRARLDLLNPLVMASYIGRLMRKPEKLFNKTQRIDAFNGAHRLKYRSALGLSPEHPTARDLRAFSPRVWSDYFKFCFVRNPYERAVSDYLWRTTKLGDTTTRFDEFLERMLLGETSHALLPNQFDNWPMYTIDDDIAVDFIGRYETLECDLNTVLQRIGLPATQRLPQEKRLRAQRNLDHWYGAKERELIEQLFAKELHFFSYQMSTS